MPLLGLRTFVQPDVAVDLGTATTRLSSSNGRLRISSPSSLDGALALRAGVIADRLSAISILRPMVRHVRLGGLTKPRAVACAPSDASAEEREAITEVVRSAGASAVVLVPEPLAAAVGAGVDISSAFARMIVDIGGGVTDFAVIRGGQIIQSSALRVACGTLEEQIAQKVQSLCGLTISAEYARGLLTRMELCESCADLDVELVGASPDGVEKRLATIHLASLRDAVDETHRNMVNTIAGFVRDLPPRVGVEVIESGIDLTGGGALLSGMRRSIEAATGIQVRTAMNSLESVVRGASRMAATGATQHLWT